MWETLFSFFTAHGYWAVFGGVAVFGDNAALIAGAMLGFGYFTFFPVLGITVVANIIPDIFLFLLGRWLRRCDFFRGYSDRRIVSWFRARARSAQIRIHRHEVKALVFIKVIPSLTWIGIIVAGREGIAWKKLLCISTIISIPRNVLFVLLGWYLGLGVLALLQYSIVYGLSFGVIIFFCVWVTSKIVTKRLEKKQT